MEREDPYASILEFCTPTCSNGVHLDLGRNKNNYLFHRTPEGVSGDEQLLPFCPIPEESLGDYFCYTPPPPETPNNPPTGNEDFSTNNTPFCVVSYQDSPPSLQGSSIPDDFPFLRLEQFDSGFEGGTMVSLDGDCTNPEMMMMMMMMGDASNLLLSRLKSLAVRVSSLDFNEEVLYGDVFSFFTDFRISVFSVHQHDTRHSSKKRKDPGFGLGLGLGLGSVPPPPPPLKKPYYLHLGSSNVNQLVDSDCGFEVVPFDFEGPLCHSPKSKGKHGAHSSESIHSGGLIHLSDEEDEEEEEEEGIGVHIVREEGMSLRESEPGSSKGDGGRTTTSLLALLKCSETLCGKV